MAKKKTTKEIEVAQGFVDTYVSLRDALKRMGILRSNRGVISDYGEWLAAKTLGLKLADSRIQQGYDAVDRRKKRVQIKTRSNANRARPAYPLKRMSRRDFDYIALVELSPEMRPIKIIVAPFETAQRHAKKYQGGYRLFANKALLNDKSIRTIRFAE